MLLVASCAQRGFEPDEEFDLLAFEAHEARAREARSAIESELEETDCVWAGYYGELWGPHLLLAPRSGFSYFVSSSCGVCGDHSLRYGTVRVDDRGRLHLEPAGQPETPLDPRVYVPFVWEGRRYLVPEDGWLDFCNGVNQGTVGDGVLIDLDGEWPEVKEPPLVPAEFERYLLDEPVRATVLRVKRGRSQEGEPRHHIWLDRGERDGLLRGMEVTLLGSEPELQTYTVQESWEDGCRAMARGGWYAPPRTGWRFWTGSPFGP